MAKLTSASIAECNYLPVFKLPNVFYSTHAKYSL